MIVLAIFVAAVIITVVLLVRARKRPEPEVRPTWNVDSVYPTDWQQGTTVAVAVPGKPGVYVAPRCTSVFTRSVDEDRTYNSTDSDLALASLAVALSTTDYASSDPSPSCDTSSYDSGSSSYDSGSSCSDTSSSFDGGSSGGGGSDGSWS